MNVKVKNSITMKGLTNSDVALLKLGLEYMRDQEGWQEYVDDTHPELIEHLIEQFEEHRIYTDGVL